jgi:hypothetical protein
MIDLLADFTKKNGWDTSEDKLQTVILLYSTAANITDNNPFRESFSCVL